jgi:hypothetical protein
VNPHRGQVSLDEVPDGYRERPQSDQGHGEALTVGTGAEGDTKCKNQNLETANFFN